MAKKVLGDFPLPDEGDIIDQVAGQQEVQQVKAGVDFLGLLAGWGFEVKKNGRGHMIRCPFHEDKTPSCSIEPDKKWFHCFGCGKKGDIIDFVRAYRNLDFPGALAVLRQNAGAMQLPAAGVLQTQAGKQMKPQTPAKPPQLSGESLDLDTIAGYYHQQLLKSRKALNYLDTRGLTDRSLLSRYLVGYCDGSLKEKLSAAQQQELRTLGILRENSREHFSGYLTFPLQDEAGRTVNLYGRSLAQTSQVPHLYLPGSMKGIFNPKAAKVYDEIILTESVIDALSLLTAGLRNVQAVYGTNGFTPEHRGHLKSRRIKTVVLALDNDDSGRRAAETLNTELLGEGIGVIRIFPAGKDWNEDLLGCGADPGKLAETVKTRLAAATRQEPASGSGELKVTKQGQKYQFTSGTVTYRVLGVKQSFVASLRVNIRAEQNGKKFLDNADLHSARSRGNLAQQLSRLFEIPEQRIENDLLAIVDWLEAERDRELAAENNEPRELSVEEKKLGMALLTSPDLMRRIVSDLEVLGYVGEDLNKQLIYLAASSRKLADPISVMILSQSASGKSLLVETVRKLIPPEDVVAVSSLSDQALNYT